MGSFVHASYQHRMGFLGNPMLMWRLRRLHRGLGRGLLLFSSAQILLGIDTTGYNLLNAEYGIGFLIYVAIAWASVIVLESIGEIIINI